MLDMPGKRWRGGNIYSSGRMARCVIGKGVNICLDLLRHLGGPSFVLSCAVRTFAEDCNCSIVFTIVAIISCKTRKYRTFVSTCYGTLVVPDLC